MNIDEFFDFLRYTPRTWCLVDNKSIRNAPAYYRGPGFGYCWPLCPITAVKSYKTGQLSEFGSGQWKQDYALLGLPEKDAISISDAADAWNDNYDTTIRARLLKACDLTEKSD